MRCYIIDSVVGDYKTKEDTYVLPILIQIGEKTYVDDAAFNPDMVELALEQKKKITTSQPNIGKTIELYERLKGEYDEFVLIHTGSKISGTYGTSVQAAKEVGLNFIAIDSQGVGTHIQYLLEYAKGKAGMKLDDLQKDLEQKASTAGAIIIPGSLERLRMSGRVSSVQALMGELLKITPIFILKNGELTVYKKERTQKKALKTMVEYVEKLQPKGQTSILEYKFEGIEQMKEAMPGVTVNDIHTALLVHLGKKSFGILWN